MTDNFKHWNTRYIYAKFRRAIFDFLNPSAPWVTKDAIRFLESHLTNESVGLEWGSGRSTSWLCKRVKFLYSVEHDKDWHYITSDDLQDQNIENVSLKLTDHQKNRGIDYVNSFEINNNFIDFILVDGKLRDKCSLRALKLLKSGGILIIDNINRYIPNKSISPDSLNDSNTCATADWEEFYKLTIDWQKIWTSDGITDTAIYFKL